LEIIGLKQGGEAGRGGLDDGIHGFGVGGLARSEIEKVGAAGFFPVKKSWKINGFEKSNYPLVQGALFQGHKSQGEAGEGGKADKGPADKGGNPESPNEPGENNPGGEFQKLLEGHVADKVKLVGGDVLGDRMFDHGLIVADWEERIKTMAKRGGELTGCSILLQ